jgi:hypothetical protein
MKAWLVSGFEGMKIRKGIEEYRTDEQGLMILVGQS